MTVRNGDSGEGAGGRTDASRRLRRALVRHGTLPVVFFDATRTALAYLAVLVLRFDGLVPVAHWHRFARLLPVAIGVHLFTNWRMRLYEQVWRHASMSEAVRVLEAGAFSLLALLLIDIVDTPRVPISVIVFGAMVSAMLTGASRFQGRLITTLNRSRRRVKGTPVVLIGDGEDAAMLIRAMRADETSTSLDPVAVLADDSAEYGRALLGVPVMGSIEDLSEIARRFDVSYALLAVSDPPRSLVRRSLDAAESAGIPLKLLPGLRDVLRVGSSVARIARDVRIEDLLGREQVSTDLAAVRRTITGRRVLITGAGGSIGSEIARQVAAMEPAELLLLDHDETHLFEAAGSVEWPAIQLLADIRDRAVIDELFEVHRPDVVFHTAAHKHVPLLEAHPCEAVRTNVIGTLNVLEAASAYDVADLVFISTDKAVDPSSIMGTSKWFGERLVQTMATGESRWCAVRFGNVLGSRGSVIPTFARQIAAGGPVTVTDPRMTRYFMSTQEAVQLVLQAATFASGGDVFLLEMGEPVNILELARKMIRLSGYVPGADIAIVMSGVRPGEKYDERLHSAGETVLPTPHSGIHRILSPAVDADELEGAVSKLGELAGARDEAAAGAVLLDLPSRLAFVAEDAIIEERWKPATT